MLIIGRLLKARARAVAGEPTVVPEAEAVSPTRTLEALLAPYEAAA